MDSGNASVSRTGVYEFQLEPGSYTLELESYDAGNLSFEGYSAEHPTRFSPLPGEHTIIVVDELPVVLPPIVLPALPRIDVRVEGDPVRVTEIGLCYETDELLCKALGNVDLSDEEAFIVPRHEFYLYFTVDGLTRFWNPQGDDPLRRQYSERARLSVPEGTVTEVFVSPPTLSRSAVVSLQLAEGWNTIGWYGGATSTHEFCQASHHVNLVAALDPENGVFRLSRCSQAVSDQTDYEVATSAIVLLQASGEARIEVPALPLDQHIAVPAGRSLLVWLGEDGVSLDVVKQGLGAAVVGLRHRSLYTHRPADADTVRKGDLLQVDATHAFDWLAPVEPKVLDVDVATSNRAVDQTTLVDR